MHLELFLIIWRVAVQWHLGLALAGFEHHEVVRLQVQRSVDRSHEDLIHGTYNAHVDDLQVQQITDGIVRQRLSQTLQRV